MVLGDTERERERESRESQDRLEIASSPLVEEEEVVGDTQLGLTFSPLQIGTTIPSSKSNQHQYSLDFLLGKEDMKMSETMHQKK
jgi:hypothetical protein